MASMFGDAMVFDTPRTAVCRG
ncbi:hypothetical protein SMALA_5239 [Streptomyces malaysiensis subsp. malaysiensis]|nr:hypothetical protein SMALA_5239 [Streptomyces malaysiensis]